MPGRHADKTSDLHKILSFAGFYCRIAHTMAGNLQTPTLSKDNDPFVASKKEQK